MKLSELSALELAEAILAWAQGDRGYQAAADVLVDTEIWLLRPEFRRFLGQPRTDDISGRVVVAIDFDKIVKAIDNGGLDSRNPGVMVLMAAASLAGYGTWTLRDCLVGLDQDRSLIVVRGIARLGMVRDAVVDPRVEPSPAGSVGMTFHQIRDRMRAALEEAKDWGRSDWTDTPDSTSVSRLRHASRQAGMAQLLLQE